MHLIDWKTVCLSRDKGGLGIYGLLNLNKALLGKWNWRFAVEDNALWREFIIIKYGTEEGGQVTQVPRGSYGVGLWKEICKEALQLKLNSEFVVGDGSMVRFWEDVWCSPNPLCNTFPMLYSLADSKGAKVDEVWEILGEGDGIQDL